MRRQKRLSIEVIFLIRFRAMVKEGKCFEYKKYVALCISQEADWFSLITNLYLFIDYPPKPKN